MKHALIKMGNFEKIGTRYFYIEKSLMQNWHSAQNTCREKGGYLASIKNKEELEKIDSKLGKNAFYWLGINDLAKEGEFVADSTGKIAKYLPWRNAQPDDYENNEDCVHISSNESQRKSLNDLPCTEKHFFICQLDNED
ncbi:hypothetical protein KR084_006211 [Drosophila pseudotakahashii]|nr:hypothetical protein KR084_006211 [Drosophila pseudotakahashii]